MQEQGMCCDGTRFFVGNTLKAPQMIFRKTVSIDVSESPDQKEQYFKESKLTVSFSSPPNSGCENCIPDEEVISYYIPEDNQSYTSYKQVRFSEPTDKTANVPQQKYRRQRSIPIPEKVQEDLIGESSQLSPNLNGHINLQDRQLSTNQNTNTIQETENQFNFNALSLQNSFCCKTISSYEQLDQANQMADELVNIVKNYLNDIPFNEKHFTFDEQEDEFRNKFNLQQKVLKKVLEHLNFKMNLTLCSPISRISATSPHFEDLHVNVKDLQNKIEEITDQNDLLKDKLEIQESKLLEQYDQIKKLHIKILELELENRSIKDEFEKQQKNAKSLNEQINQQRQQLEEYVKTLQCQQLKIQQLEQLLEKYQKNNKSTNQSLNINLNQFSKPVRRHTNSFHEVCSSPNGNKLVIVNSSTNSSQQSPRNLQLSNNHKVQLLDDTTYFGSILNDKKQGYGNLRKGDKKLYMGFWKDDNFNGFGHLNNETVEHGVIDLTNLDNIGNKWISYQGEFQDGLFHGYGIWTFSDNSRFHGLFQLGKANGRGYIYIIQLVLIIQILIL
ncbi:unnamed protein product (macronuclear) [Paramecium tetraurelia]|uniref:Uncharacterized protein n=1 Tax=Paramecium tetraurelia TaxID=5888 RepID=A0DN46_PARTE|nr:uncharacterized protein GSPATT00018668001 [Paramecium tetraurelia]CAK84463.1 unnamed protein product [Paramecium tetraurelia]|eukprot:XP_001451860.1 hypothetical protein (macronuclear) [Paramecium tetraurelia strain d4-2]